VTNATLPASFFDMGQLLLVDGDATHHSEGRSRCDLQR